MQTFLPYPGFKRSLAVLDYRRLGKQRLEAVQLVRSIEAPSGRGWMRHPARLQWVDNLDALKLYANDAISEWVARGFDNEMEKYRIPPRSETRMPWWFGNTLFHSTHRSRLLSKDYDFYRKLGWKDDPEAGYFWPVTKSNFVDLRRETGKGINSHGCSPCPECRGEQRRVTCNGVLAQISCRDCDFRERVGNPLSCGA